VNRPNGTWFWYGLAIGFILGLLVMM